MGQKLLVLCCVLLAGLVHAANLRGFPEASQPATFSGFAGAEVKLGQRMLPVAPGLQIRDPDNRIIQPGTLDGVARLPVQVQFDSNGALWRMWILSAEEARAAQLR